MGLLTSVKKLWVTWDLRVCIITSLSLQAFLLLLAPFRQRSRSGLLFKSVWATYLLADWIAAVAIGLIAKSLGHSNDHKNNNNLFALWASFLLMHLGGPDGITSLSLEDNELWIRHLFGLLLQVASAIYSLYLTFTRNKLWRPSILVFVGGTIKFAERTWALRLASLDSFGESALPDPNPGPDYEEAAPEYSVMMSAQFLAVSGGGRGGIGNVLSDSITKVEGGAQKNTKEMKKLEVAHSLFESFKGLIVGFLISSKDRDSSRNYFMQQAPEYAFGLVEYELSFMYQVLHTKSVVIHTKIGYALRGVSFLSTFGASLFFLFVDKSGFGNFEVAVTYALFIGAIVLDFISIAKLAFSDWVLLALKDRQIIKYVPTCILKRSRWSGSVSQVNMISYCLPPTVKLWFRELNSYRHVYGIRTTIKMILRYSPSLEKVHEDLRKFVIEELQKKSKKATDPRDAMEACSQRGDSALLQTPSSYTKLKWSIGEFQYAESLLLWHLATELLCYKRNSHEQNSHEQNSKSSNYQEESDSIFMLLCERCFISSCCRCIPKLLRKLWSLIRTIYFWANRHLLPKCFHNLRESPTETRAISEEETYKEISKVLSNYMFYLLVDKQAMLAPVLGNWNIVFQDTRAEAKRFFMKHKLSRHSEACNRIFKVKAKVRSVAVKENRSKSVLFDACILARQLNEEKEEKWKIMSRVWVELLSYAAINCRPFVHAQQLSKGGELLTFTWLLMNHLGMGAQFAEQEQQSGTKMETIIETQSIDQENNPSMQRP